MTPKSKKRKIFIKYKTLTFVFLSLMVSTLIAFWFFQGSRSTVQKERLANFKRGINVINWIDIEPERIKSTGFDHIRLLVDPDLYKSDERFFESLEFTLKELISRDLSVIIGVHEDKPTADHEFWRNLAKFVSQFDPNHVMLQIPSEIATTTTTIREAAPHHTLIAKGGGYSLLDDLLAMEPLGDKNVIYDFHFYSPGIFTRQKFKDIPYPFGPEDESQILAQIPLDDKKSLLQFHEAYGGREWNRARIEGFIKKASEWSHKWGVPVICAEFGANKTAEGKHRAAWIYDVRTTLEKYDIGWTLWSYDGQYSIMTEINRKLTPDPLILKALELQE